MNNIFSIIMTSIILKLAVVLTVLELFLSKHICLITDSKNLNKGMICCVMLKSSTILLSLYDNPFRIHWNTKILGYNRNEDENMCCYFEAELDVMSNYEDLSYYLRWSYWERTLLHMLSNFQYFGLQRYISDLINLIDKTKRTKLF